MLSQTDRKSTVLWLCLALAVGWASIFCVTRYLGDTTRAPESSVVKASLRVVADQPPPAATKPVSSQQGDTKDSTGVLQDRLLAFEKAEKGGVLSDSQRLEHARALLAAMVVEVKSGREQPEAVAGVSWRLWSELEADPGRRKELNDAFMQRLRESTPR